MTNALADEFTERKPIRLWPGIVAVAVQWLTGFILPIFVPEVRIYGMLFGFLGGGLAVLLWWLFFSRAPWIERLGYLVVMPVAVFATSYFIDQSIAKAGMGMMLPIFAIPVLSLALVCGSAVGRRGSNRLRRASIMVGILLACAIFPVLRIGGISGDGEADLHWRWAQTPEERLLAQGGNEPAVPSALTSAEATAVARWPGFRGPGRDGVVRGERIATDWLQSPPIELWRRRVGPGWSSFAVGGDLLYTQEQRGDDEVVACYRLTTGQPVWRHADPARFWEPAAGAGPRATPTLSNGRVYTLGATGIVNALNAADGAVVWTRNATSDTGRKVPDWGFAGSPLIVDDNVVIAASGKLVAYDLKTGNPRWVGPAAGGSYSSPHLATMGGVKQILLVTGAGAISVAPDTGTQLWKYGWHGDGIVQPALTTDGDVLIGSGSGLGGATVGVHRLAVAHGPDGWTAGERWTSVGLKPHFNDFVVHQGHAFGFDGGFLACIDLKDGRRKWKGGRYGHGQVLLVAEQDLLLVLSEKGGLALVAATPDSFREVARHPAIEGKSWNHPVLAGGILLVRNGEEMVAFQLSGATGPAKLAEVR